MSDKPHKGVLDNWVETPGNSGLGYRIHGLANGHPELDGEYFTTSAVLSKYGNEIETHNSEYTLGVPAEDVKRLVGMQLPEDSRLWPYYPIEMPLYPSGEGPASIEDATSMTYEVWDRICMCHGIHSNLPDALNQAIQLTLQDMRENAP